MSLPPCPQCHEKVDTNGIGSTVGFWETTGTKALNAILWKSCKLFKEAGDRHDWRYHVYGYGKKKADHEFLRDMIRATLNRPNPWRIGDKWHRFTARRFYAFVRDNGYKAYAQAQSECLANQMRFA